MSISIWDYEKPLDAMVLNHDHMAALLLKHDQQIKDLAAHLLELKQLVTPMMEFKRREWVGLTDDEIKEIANNCRWSETYHIDFSRAIEAKLRKKNT